VALPGDLGAMSLRAGQLRPGTQPCPSIACFYRSGGTRFLFTPWSRLESLPRGPSFPCRQVVVERVRQPLDFGANSLCAEAF